jgi:hypothetical protein
MQIGEPIMLLSRAKAELKSLSLATRAFSSCVRANMRTGNVLGKVKHKQSF